MRAWLIGPTLFFLLGAFSLRCNRPGGGGAGSVGANTGVLSSNSEDGDVPATRVQSSGVGAPVPRSQ